MLKNRTERALRLVDIVSRWWDGEPVREIAERHGISMSRAYVLLRRAGCHWRQRRQKHASKYDDPACPPSVEDVARALAAVEDPLFRRLTTRQRSALCWRAAALNIGQISARMQVYPSVAVEHLRGALWRFEVVARDREKRRMSRRGERVANTAVVAGYGLLEIEDLLGRPAPDSTDVEH